MQHLPPESVGPLSPPPPSRIHDGSPLAAAHPTPDESQRKLAVIEELMGLGSWEWNIVTNTITSSAEQLSIHGADPAERTQELSAFLQRIHSDDRERVLAEIKRTLETGVPLTMPYRIVAADGTVREMEALGKLLPGPGGGAERIVGLSRDVTQRNEAERALRASEESYRTMFLHATDAIWVHDINTGAVLDANLAAAAMFGYTVEEMMEIGPEALHFTATDYAAEKFAEYLTRAVAGESPRFDCLGRHRDGGEVCAEVRLRRVTIRGEDRILASARDVRERKAAEHALRQVNEELEQRVAERTSALAQSNAALARSEEQFRRMIENGSDYIMIVDTTGAITYIGPSVERILGYAPEEMLGQRPHDLVHPDDVALANKTVQLIADNPGQVHVLEFRIRHRDGSYRIFEAFGRTLLEDTADAGIVSNGRDITERKRAEEELSRQKAYFEEILDSIDAGVAVFDPQTRFEYIAATAIRDPEIRRWVIGKTNLEYGKRRGLPPGVAEQRQQSIEAAIATRVPHQFEQQIRGLDGSPRHMLRRVVPILDGQGEVLRLVGYSVDISERKGMEIALNTAKEEAERANGAKSEFLSRMSHELRTPLNAILGFAQVLEQKDLPPEHRKYTGHILKGGRHLLRLINEVLELARIEAGRMSFSLEPIGITAVVREALELVRPLADQVSIELDPPTIEGAETFVQADRQRLVQVLLNLLSNAIKYNRPGGRVSISGEAIASGDGMAGYAVRVRDTGKGIPDHSRHQLFTPFNRLGAEQTETEGTGLGLALSQRLAEAMGGTLFLESTGPEGSVFRVDLQRADDPLESVRSSGEVSESPAMAPAAATILYIEDNLTNLSLVETLLESKPQFRTLSALRGQAGIELARERRPDLILLDLHLPDVTGDEVLRQLRADPRTSGIPVIVISADATGAAVKRLREAGADHYLTKPIDVNEFHSVVERFLSAGR